MKKLVFSLTLIVGIQSMAETKLYRGQNEFGECFVGLETSENQQATHKIFFAGQYTSQDGIATANGFSQNPATRYFGGYQETLSFKKVSRLTLYAKADVTDDQQRHKSTYFPSPTPEMTLGDAFELASSKKKEFYLSPSLTEPSIFSMRSREYFLGFLKSTDNAASCAKLTLLEGEEVAATLRDLQEK